MSRHLLALAVAAALATALAGCSSSDSGDSDDDSTPDTTNGGGGDGDTGDDTGDGEQTFTPRPTRPDGPRGEGAPTSDTKPGNYFGSLGFGDGVYVIDGRGELFGLVLDGDDSSARSFFGNVGTDDTFTGALRTYEHNASNPPSAGGFGTGPTSQQVEDSPADYTTGEYTMTFSAPEAQIVAVDGDDNTNTLSFADNTGQLSPASAAGVSGSWRGVNQFSECSGGACQLVFDITFDGTTISGTTSVQDGTGERSRENAISGGISEYGDTLLLTFTWTEGDTTSEYQGIAFFPDSTGRLVFLGETDDERAGLPVLASLLDAVQ